MSGILKSISKLTMFMGLSEDDMGGADASVSIAIKDLDKCAWCNSSQMATPFISNFDKGISLYNHNVKREIISKIKNNFVRQEPNEENIKWCSHVFCYYCL